MVILGIIIYPFHLKIKRRLLSHDLMEYLYWSTLHLGYEMHMPYARDVWCWSFSICGGYIDVFMVDKYIVDD